MINEQQRQCAYICKSKKDLRIRISSCFGRCHFTTDLEIDDSDCLFGRRAGRQMFDFYVLPSSSRVHHGHGLGPRAPQFFSPRNQSTTSQSVALRHYSASKNPSHVYSRTARAIKTELCPWRRCGKSEKKSKIGKRMGKHSNFYGRQLGRKNEFALNPQQRQFKGSCCRAALGSYVWRVCWSHHKVRSWWKAIISVWKQYKTECIELS